MKAKRREKIPETRTNSVGCKEVEAPIAKPANHDPSCTIAVVVVPDPDPDPVTAPYTPSEADPYVISADPPVVELELIGSDPDTSGVVVVTGVALVTGVASLDDF